MEEMKSFMLRKEDVSRKWYLIDAKDKVLGRLCVKIVNILSGKLKPVYTSHVDAGDGVIVINADKFRVTGKKLEDKTYMSYSGYPSGLKYTVMKDIKAKKPEFIIMHAVKGMLPKNRLGSKMLTRLRVCTDSENPFKSVKAEVINL